ncbi:MAG: hypothetical protein WD278_07145 [Pirellulales bacterium]
MPLLPASFLFRFAVPCRFKDPLWTDAGPQLDESYRLASPADLDVQRTFAEVRAAWSQAGLAISARVEG